MKLFVLLLTVLPTLAVGAATTPTRSPAARSMSINPDHVQTPKSPRAYPPAPAPRAVLTNGERLARGMAPKKPRLTSSTREAKRASPSALAYSGKILVKGVDGTTFGYISQTWNAYGEYGLVQSSPDGALVVSFTTADGSSPFDMLATNGPSATYPFMGLTSGYASTSYNIGSGSYNYLTVTGTTQTPANSPPVEGDNNSFGDVTGIPGATESAVWMIDFASGVLSPQWVNTDGSKPANHIVFSQRDNAFIVTGDVAAFANVFQSNTEVKFYFVRS